jgi:hypothetical protein
VRIIGPNGLEVPRDLVAFNTLKTFVYFYIAEIQPAEVQTYRLIYSNTAAGSPDTLVYPYHPAYLTDWVTATASGAVDAAKLYIDTTSIGPTYGGDSLSLFSGGRDNKYKDGALYFTQGANAGSVARLPAMSGTAALDRPASRSRPHSRAHLRRPTTGSSSAAAMAHGCTMSSRTSRGALMRRVGAGTHHRANHRQTSLITPCLVPCSPICTRMGATRRGSPGTPA